MTIHSANGFFPVLAEALGQIRTEILAPYYLDKIALFLLLGAIVAGLVNWFWKSKA